MLHLLYTYRYIFVPYQTVVATVPDSILQYNMYLLDFIKENDRQRKVVFVTKLFEQKWAGE